MIINIDVDGVLCNFISGYLELVKKVTGRSYAYDDVTDYEFKCLGLTTEEQNEIEKEVFRPGWCRSLQSLPGTYEGIASLEKDGHEIYFVTSPWKKHPTWASERDAWLHERWPNAKIISTRHKHRVHADIFVDDKMNAVRDWLKIWKDGIGVVWDAPYNRTHFFPGIRAKTWDFVREAASWGNYHHPIVIPTLDDPFRVGE